jgi:hypothetical protein
MLGRRGLWSWTGNHASVEYLQQLQEPIAINFIRDIFMPTIYQIPYRQLPLQGIVSNQYKNDRYVMSEYGDDFGYYENTDINKVNIDEHHLVSWTFFSSEGINYLLPRIIINIQLNVSDIPTNLQSFITDLIYQKNLKDSLQYLNRDELTTMKNFFEWLLFDKPEALKILGENTLINNASYIENLINHNSPS